MSLLRKRIVTPRMLAANRLNAQKSTGPRTAAGKARSRMNALKHGERSKILLERFKDWLENYLNSFEPMSEPPLGALGAVSEVEPPPTLTGESD